MNKVLALLSVCSGLLLAPALVQAESEGEWSGYVSAEWRVFLQSPIDNDQHGDNTSFSIQPEYYKAWNNDKRSFTFVPFLRLDGRDSERTHADIRELHWDVVGDDWEIQAGVGKVFWGVTESQHLVDIINQTDLVENIDGEEKLGQALVKLTLVRDWGDVDLFLLGGSRERTFPGRKGRLRSQAYVDTNEAEYATNAGRDNVDIAIRYSHSIGDIDLGVSHFSGTSREPRFRPSRDGSGRPILIPIYESIDQTSLDVQATKDDWLWKLELITRSGQGGRYTALTGGFEYTLYGINESSADLGLIMEYLYDDRADNASTPFANDVFFGARLALNDENSSELLAGIIQDADTSSRLYSVEASRRIGDNWKLSLEARLFSNIENDDILFSQRNDDYAQLELNYFF